MHKIAPLFALSLPLLAACSTLSEAPAQCDAGPAQARLGEPYSEALGQELLGITGAKVLRAVGENDPVTMDYREDRLTVAWNDSRRIIRITCG